ncbi:MAG: hypothetical protein ACJAWK_000873 [Candidatus Azotimanducaceae bacterium]|jgi:hypothetical protein
MNTNDDKPWIPSAEHFARAQKAIKDRSTRANALKTAIVADLPAEPKCHLMWVWVTQSGCAVDVILESDLDLLAHKGGATFGEPIQKATLKQGFTDVQIRYHSHEYILKNHSGDYDEYFS